MKATVAGAPVSFGVFEMTPEGAETISPDGMLEILAGADYRGVDLGPMGYLGDSTELRRRLRTHELELAGGWVQLPMSDDDAFEASLPNLHAALRTFSEAAEEGPSRLPLPTLADDGSLLRREAPGRGSDVDSLDDDAWRRLTVNAGRAAQLVRAAGFEPTFHHHAGTFVESPSEIDRFLEDTDLQLTLDSGHLAIAGGDPVEAVQRWGARINHLHLKDVDLDLLARVLAAGGGMREVWQSGTFVAFGKGSIDLPGVLDAAAALDFDGWIVVEQDVLNPPNVRLDEFVRARSADQVRNREELRAWA